MDAKLFIHCKNRKWHFAHFPQLNISVDFCRLGQRAQGQLWNRIWSRKKEMGELNGIMFLFPYSANRGKKCWSQLRKNEFDTNRRRPSKESWSRHGPPSNSRPPTLTDSKL
jgi:hypothetical protein